METKKKSTSSRERIAKIVTWSVPSATAILAIVALWFSFCKLPADQANENLKYVFTALLPLWGTWFGTVLAYYFSKDNFEAANENTRKLVAQVTTASEKLQKIKAKSVMITFDQMNCKIFKEQSELEAYKVDDGIKYLDQVGRNRLPLLLNKQLKYVIHLSTFDLFFRLSGGEPNLTIKDMISSANQKIADTLQNGAKFISLEANLLEAKKLMDSFVSCNDVFVTQNGKQDEDVLGWISDKIINENAKV